MSNENDSGLDIYLEYVREQFDNVKACDNYLFGGRPLTREDNWLNGIYVPTDVEDFTRAPKTISINGKDVPAPRYDDPKDGQIMYWFNIYYAGGVEHDFENKLSDSKIGKIIDFGWFDKRLDAITYANAHRENKT